MTPALELHVGAARSLPKQQQQQLTTFRPLVPQEEMAAEMPNVKFVKLDCTTDPAAKKIAMGLGIKALPTFNLYKNNEKVGTFVGGKPTGLRKFLDEQLQA